jgi:hypothetical protein
VFLAPSIPVITSDLAPGEKQRPWPPISSTLISGERDAVLVDTPITVEQARALANWVVASGKNLTTIYATQAHANAISKSLDGRSVLDGRAKKGKQSEEDDKQLPLFKSRSI